MPDQEASRRQGAGSAVAGVLLATVVLLGLATWAASIGTDDVVGDGPGAGWSASRPTDPNTATGPRDEVRHGDDPPPRREHSAWLTLLARTLIVLAVALLAYHLVRRAVALVRRLRRRGRRPPRPPDEPDGPTDVLAQATSAAESILGDAQDQRALLETGPPRNAIVACWHRFEVQAADAGVPRKRHETSSEFTLRLLDLVDADLAAVAVLARLYREARFSDHELGEPARDEAGAALAALHRGLSSRWARSGR